MNACIHMCMAFHWTRAHWRLADLQATGILLAVPLQRWGSRSTLLCSAFLLGYWGLNSGPNFCATGVILQTASPVLYPHCLKNSSICYSVTVEWEAHPSGFLLGIFYHHLPLGGSRMEVRCSRAGRLKLKSQVTVNQLREPKHTCKTQEGMVLTSGTTGLKQLTSSWFLKLGLLCKECLSLLVKISWACWPC